MSSYLACQGVLVSIKKFLLSHPIVLIYKNTGTDKSTNNCPFLSFTDVCPATQAQGLFTKAESNYKCTVGQRRKHCLSNHITTKRDLEFHYKLFEISNSNSGKKKGTQLKPPGHSSLCLVNIFNNLQSFSYLKPPFSSSVHSRKSMDFISSHSKSSFKT